MIISVQIILLRLCWTSFSGAIFCFTLGNDGKKKKPGASGSVSGSSSSSRSATPTMQGEAAQGTSKSASKSKDGQYIDILIYHFNKVSVLFSNVSLSRHNFEFFLILLISAKSKKDVSNRSTPTQHGSKKKSGKVLYILNTIFCIKY